MFKKIVLLGLCLNLFFARFVVAQDSISTNKHVNVGIGTLHDNGYFALNHFLNPFLSINIKNHVVAIGAIINPENVGKSDSYTKHHSPLTGVIAWYRYFPEGRRKRFNLFLEGNFIYDHTHDTYSFKPFSHPSSFDYYDETKRTCLSTVLSTGFTFNISKKVHVYECTGAGLSLTKKYVSDTVDGTTSYQKNDFSLNIKIGFEYDFNMLLPNRQKKY